MGVVYKALDTRQDRIVALKVLNRQAALDVDVQKRFLREAGAGAGLVHPSIVQMYEAGMHEGQSSRGKTPAAVTMTSTLSASTVQA